MRMIRISEVYIMLRSGTEPYNSQYVNSHGSVGCDQQSTQALLYKTAGIKLFQKSFSNRCSISKAVDSAWYNTECYTGTTAYQRVGGPCCRCCRCCCCSCTLRVLAVTPAVKYPFCGDRHSTPALAFLALVSSGHAAIVLLLLFWV